METISRPRRFNATVTVRCESCNDPGLVTDRQYRRKQELGRPHLCKLCRMIKVKPPTQAHFNFWLDRFTIEEIREMGQAIWG